jgi:hypothetical protein
MQTIWTDEIEARDLQDVKEGMKAVENDLRMLQEEIRHLEGKHCRQG